MADVMVIGVNGPPGSGKDTFGSYLSLALSNSGYPNGVHKMSHALKDSVHSLFGMGGVPTGHFEGQIKETPLDELFGMSPREAYIWLSEQCVKPKFGDRFFPEILASRVERWAEKEEEYWGKKPVTAIVTDIGFQPEWDFLVERFGTDGTHLVHMIRDGHNFDGDSRSYIESGGSESDQVVNGGRKEDLYGVAQDVLVEMGYAIPV